LPRRFSHEFIRFHSIDPSSVGLGCVVRCRPFKLQHYHR
jgi:hypothetical protein